MRGRSCEKSVRGSHLPGWALTAIPYVLRSVSEKAEFECVPWSLEEWTPSDESFVCNVLPPVRSKSWQKALKENAIRSGQREILRRGQRLRCGELLRLRWQVFGRDARIIHDAFIVPNNRARLVQNNETRALIVKALGMSPSASTSPTPAELETLLFALHAWEGGFAQKRPKKRRREARAPKVEIKPLDPVYELVKELLRGGTVTKLTCSGQLQEAVPFMRAAKKIQKEIKDALERVHSTETVGVTTAEEWHPKHLAFCIPMSDEDATTADECD